MFAVVSDLLHIIVFLPQLGISLLRRRIIVPVHKAACRRSCEGDPLVLHFPAHPVQYAIHHKITCNIPKKRLPAADPLPMQQQDVHHFMQQNIITLSRLQSRKKIRIVADLPPVRHRRTDRTVLTQRDMHHNVPIERILFHHIHLKTLQSLPDLFPLFFPGFQHSHLMQFSLNASVPCNVFFLLILLLILLFLLFQK